MPSFFSLWINFFMRINVCDKILSIFATGGYLLHSKNRKKICWCHKEKNNIIKVQVKIKTWKFSYFIFLLFVLFFLILFYLFFFIQQILISHQFYTHQCIHVNTNRPIHHTTTIPTPAPGFPPLVSIRFFSTSVSQFLPCKLVHLYHFSSSHIYALIYDNYFSLSDLLHSVWQSLDPSTSQQMPQYRSLLWLSNISLYICTTSSLSILLSMGI